MHARAYAGVVVLLIAAACGGSPSTPVPTITPAVATPTPALVSATLSPIATPFGTQTPAPTAAESETASATPVVSTPADSPTPRPTLRSVEAAVVTELTPGLNHPAAITLDASGNLVIADGCNDRFLVVDADGAVVRELTEVAGTPFSTCAVIEGRESGFGAPAAWGDNELVLVDTNNQRVVHVTGNGRLIGELDPGPAGFGHPYDVAVAPDGSALFVIDDERGILAFDSSLEFSGVVGDTAPLGAYAIPNSGGIAVGPSGEVLVADWERHRMLVFPAGGGAPAEWGTRGQATPGSLQFPVDVDVDEDGTVMVVEWQNARLQAFTLAGSPLFVIHDSHDGPLFERPVGIAFGLGDEIWVSDHERNRVVAIELGPFR